MNPVLILIQMHGFRGENPLVAFLDSDRIFYGLSSEYLLHLHKEISFLVKTGQFTYSDIMVMPTYSRRIFIHNLTKKEE